MIVEQGCTGAVRFEGGGDERNWRMKIDPRASRYVSVEPGRKIWSLSDIPNPAALFNATIVVQDIGDGRAAFARSDGTNWYFSPMETTPLPKSAARASARPRPPGQ